MNRKLVNEAKGIINCGLSYRDGVVAWTGGKDSTVILHLIKEMFGWIKYSVFFNDTEDVFDEQYYFINNLQTIWDFRSKVTIVKNPNKVEAINYYLDTFKPGFIMTGIRADEHPDREVESLISLRRDHIRLHPLLNWTEKDVWIYIHENNVPYCSLYRQGYRSLGEKSKTRPVPDGGRERDGRESEKEKVMSELRKAGYY